MTGPEPFDFRAETEDVMRRAITDFAAWLAVNYATTEAEARTLTDKAACPADYARGYNDALAAVPAAFDLWMEGHL